GAAPTRAPLPCGAGLAGSRWASRPPAAELVGVCLEAAPHRAALPLRSAESGWGPRCLVGGERGCPADAGWRRREGGCRRRGEQELERAEKAGQAGRLQVDFARFSAALGLERALFRQMRGLVFVQAVHLLVPDGVGQGEGERAQGDEAEQEERQVAPPCRVQDCVPGLVCPITAELRMQALHLESVLPHGAVAEKGAMIPAVPTTDQ